MDSTSSLFLLVMYDLLYALDTGFTSEFLK